MANSRVKSTPATPPTGVTPTGVTPTGVTPTGEITGGVDTHKMFHLAAARDGLGRLLGTRKFPATLAGYTALLTWLAGFGPLAKVGVEGTGCYGAGLTTYLMNQDVRVVEIDRPNRQKRRRNGKSDPIDAIAAAAAAQSGEATTAPKPRTGPIESVRVLRETRTHLSKARVAAINTLKAILITAPPALREQLEPLADTTLITLCAAFPPLPTPTGLRGHAKTTALTTLTTHLLDSDTTTRHTLGELARTITHYTNRITELDTCLHALVTRIAPRTSALFGVGPGRAAQLLLTASGHPNRIHSEPAFAKLTGTAPQQCGSGQHADQHRLSRAGDRQANSVLYYIVLTRLAHHQPTRTYLTTRLNTNHSNKKHLIRCLKRYLTREIYPHLKADLTNLTDLQNTT